MSVTILVTIGHLALFLRSYQFESERKYNNMDTKELSYEVIESIGVISEKNSYTKEVNRISWNGKPPVCDIRGLHHDCQITEYGPGDDLWESKYIRMSYSGKA